MRRLLSALIPPAAFGNEVRVEELSVLALASWQSHLFQLLHRLLVFLGTVVRLLGGETCADFLLPRLQSGGHFGHFRRPLSGEVVGFAGVPGDVVQLVSAVLEIVDQLPVAAQDRARPCREWWGKNRCPLLGLR